jgi:hypothetical protein
MAKSGFVQVDKILSDVVVSAPITAVHAYKSRDGYYTVDVKPDPVVSDLPCVLRYGGTIWRSDTFGSMFADYGVRLYQASGSVGAYALWVDGVEVASWKVTMP